MTGFEFAEKFRELESRVAADRGDFVLFALFIREDVPDRWDLLVSAPWIGDNKDEVVDYLALQIGSGIGSQALTEISRIVVIDPGDPAVEAFNRAIRVEHGSVEVKDSNFFGLPVKHAYIITSRMPATQDGA
jgi:hypothetical protein